MKIWHLLAVASGSIIAVAMALASVSYNATLATPGPAFAWLPVLTNVVLFSSLALAFDLGMVASVFGFMHWRGADRIKALLCAVLFVIASIYSVHSVRGYIALNLTRSQAPAERAADNYASLRLELHSDQQHLQQLRTRFAKTGGRVRRRDLERTIARLTRKIHELRNHLAQTDIGHRVLPLDGLEWFLAITLWFFNATCWSAWFGDRTPAPRKSNDSVVSWLADYDLSQPEHCTVLFAHYERWCARKHRAPLAQYSFYARLVELGANKFRDGRNGPTKYVLPARDVSG